MNKTRFRMIIAAATLALFAQVSQAAPIVFDFGGSFSLTCSSNSGSCDLTDVNNRFLNLNPSKTETISGEALVKSLNYALTDVNSIGYWAGTWYVDLGRIINASSIVATIKQDSGVLDSLAWRPSNRFIGLGRFEWRQVNTPKSVPEPGTWALMIAALFCMGLMYRRQRLLEGR